MVCDGEKRRRWVEAGTRRGNGDAGNHSFMEHEVEGVPVNLDGESRHERAQAKSSRRESEALGEEGGRGQEPVKERDLGGIRRHKRSKGPESGGS